MGAGAFFQGVAEFLSDDIKQKRQAERDAEKQAVLMEQEYGFWTKKEKLRAMLEEEKEKRKLAREEVSKVADSKAGVYHIKYADGHSEERPMLAAEKEVEQLKMRGALAEVSGAEAKAAQSVFENEYKEEDRVSKNALQEAQLAAERSQQASANASREASTQNTRILKTTADYLEGNPEAAALRAIGGRGERPATESIITTKVDRMATKIADLATAPFIATEEDRVAAEQILQIVRDNATTDRERADKLITRFTLDPVKAIRLHKQGRLNELWQN